MANLEKALLRPGHTPLVRDTPGKEAHQSGGRCISPDNVLGEIRQVIEASTPIHPFPSVQAVPNDNVVAPDPKVAPVGGSGGQIHDDFFQSHRTPPNNFGLIY